MNSDGELFRVNDWEGNEVLLESEQWRQHIIRGHPEVEPYLEGIAETVTRPHFVLSSESDADVKLFYRKGFAQGKYDMLYLKVVVNYRERPASVRTAFFTASLSGGEVLCAQYP